MENDQKIDCNVDSCMHNDINTCTCKLERIHVCPCKMSPEKSAEAMTACSMYHYLRRFK
ncbi:MAG: DUF1540 domain-containing protein [Clostridia bacterium]|nr:DUF1540 domain-containing protein [Clostridia bacterium]